MFLLSVPHPLDCCCAQLEVCGCWDRGEHVAFVHLLHPIQGCVRFTKLSQEGILGELEPRERHTEFLSDDVIQVPFLCEESSGEGLDLGSGSILQVAQVPQIQILWLCERDMILEPQLLNDVVVHGLPVRRHPRLVSCRSALL
jgi:hypothetical protein